MIPTMTTDAPTHVVDPARLIEQLRSAAANATSDEEMRAVVARIASLTRTYRIQRGIGLPGSPLIQAKELDALYRSRPHIEHLSDQLSKAVRRVEMGRNQQIAVSMPPRAGKSTLLSLYTPVWLLRRHPEWSIILTSHDGGLSTGWARQIRYMIEDRPEMGIALARDNGAQSNWATVEGGGMYAVGIGGALTGRGARVLVIDDPISDFVAAHSPRLRQNLWDWWLSVAQTRLEPPYLVIVVMTRWHEDDFVGRLFSDEHEGDPKTWQRISLPAIADTQPDAIGRELGEPLISPLLRESPEEAIARWAEVKGNVGTYTFSAMYQQRPAPAKGAIFDAGWWRFWTTNEHRATIDGRVMYLDPNALGTGQWVDSWDASFDSPEGGSYVVGQRWVRHRADRFLVAQQRGRWSFTQTLERMTQWAWQDDPVASPYGQHVHQRLIEKKANGAAIIDTLRKKFAGLKAINPSASKEARARAITPEVESGNVYLPHPADPGNEWVNELLSELRNFPHDAADDQVDCLTQALIHLRNTGRGQLSVPARTRPYGVVRDIASAARSDRRRGFRATG
jgi:predicted phage terminase large subunit-like protein